MNTKRQKYMNFRLSDSEYQQLQARIKNSGVNTQQFMLRAVLESDSLRERFQIDHDSVILLINTEGDTDPASYRKIVS